MTTLYDIRRHKLRQVLEPQAGRFSLAMPELPRLDDLIRLANAAADNRNRVLYCDPRYRGVHESVNELKRRLLFHYLVLEPPRTADRKMGAGGERDHQIPSPKGMPDGMDHIVLNMIPRSLCRQQITRPRIVTPCRERIAHNAAELAGD
jgi:hypothetical protein